jgi:dienelactone hydrolase
LTSSLVAGKRSRGLIRLGNEIGHARRIGAKQSRLESAEYRGRGRYVGCRRDRNGEIHHKLDTRSQFPVLLYAPANGGAKDDNASTTAELASHGYVVMAIDDIDRDPRSPTATDDWQPLTFDFSSAEAFKTTLRIGDRKVRRQAEKALTALDQLNACANADWRTRIQFDRIGFFGFSIGGSTAAEAGTFDPRVVAVANLDGWLFGRAAFGALDKPYLVILTENAVFPMPRQLQSPNQV